VCVCVCVSDLQEDLKEPYVEGILSLGKHVYLCSKEKPRFLRIIYDVGVTTE